MAQLDSLIAALARHGAEALVLEPGQKPFLVLGGSRRPIVNQALSAPQVGRLVSEIAPPEQRPAAGEGGAVQFGYAHDGRRVAVSGAAASGITITPADDGGPAAPSAPPAAEAGTRAEAVPGHMDELFRAMVSAGASDLHLSSGSPPLLRIDGELAPMPGRPALSGDALDGLLREITPDKDWRIFGESSDADFAYEIPGLSRFRCNLFRDRKGAGGVFRVIPAKVLTVDDLDLSPEIRELCFLTKGLVLLTGPTGSGKSTTLAALVDHINKNRSDHIITIEDPIEFVHDNRRCLINQREVGQHTRGFKQALRAALREDPDIVLVGEMRDLETVAIALETAETGHLVFGTLHTTSAISTVDRLIDQFPADRQDQVRVMLSESLRAVIAQVLCRRKGGGRVAALEVLMALPSVSNLIREGKTFQLQSIMQTGRKHGMITLNDSLLRLVKEDVVEPREAYLKALDKQGLLSALKNAKIPIDFLEGGEAPG